MGGYLEARVSKVTQCDFCGSTARASSEFVSLKLPRACLPSAIPSSSSPAEVDACHACADEIREVLDDLITRRLAGGEPATEGDVA